MADPVVAVQDKLHPLMPIVKENLEKLASIPPGDQNVQPLIATILALIKAMLADPTIGALLPATWQKYAAAISAAITLLLGGGLFGRYVVPAAPAPAPTKIEYHDKSTDNPIVQPPSPVVPPAKTMTLKFWK